MRYGANDQYIRDLITYYLLGIGGLTVCCFGLIGNILSLIVLSHRTMKSSTYSYLSALAVCDFLVLIFTIVLLVKDVERPVKGENKWPWADGIYPYLFPYVHPAAFSFQVISIWLTLAFTVDRYLMICHPFSAEPYCTVSRARKVIVGLFVGGLIFNIPKFFEYETLPVPMPITNETKVVCDLTEFGRSTIFRELYHSWLYIICICGVPFVILAVLNSFLMHAVRVSRQRGQEINSAEKKRNDTTIMLIGVVVIFFLCQMPALVSRTIWAFDSNPRHSFKKLSLYTMNEIGNFLIVLNSSINIVPYYFFGRRFRRQFWKLFCVCLLRYKRFQRLSRSFSVTVMERKASNGMAQGRACHDYELAHGPEDQDRIRMISAAGEGRDTEPRKASALTQSSELEYEPDYGRPIVGNGSCKKFDVHAHLLEGQGQGSLLKKPGVRCLQEEEDEQGSDKVEPCIKTTQETSNIWL